MAKKHFTLRWAGLSLCLFLSVFLMAFSCQDHVVVPNNPAPTTIRTDDAVIFSLGLSNITYRYQFESLGTIPVVEHGVVRVIADLNQNNIVPTVADQKITSSSAASIQQVSVNEAIGLLLNPKRIFFRAYAMLENGTIVYGEVKSRLNIADNPVDPTIETLPANVSSGSVKFGVKINPTNIPVTEYGVLYVLGNDVTANLIPTENDQIVVFTKPLGAVPVFEDKSLKGQAPFFFYRAYAKLLNGNTVYGNVKVDGTTQQ